MKICHVTSVHSSNDTRIFYKECTSLAKAGFEVFLVAKGENREENSVHVIGIGDEPTNRLLRIAFFTQKAYRTAIELGCDIYHLHDPELLPYVRKFKREGKKVIFDFHEDVASQVLDKKWIPRIIRNTISKTYQLYEIRTVGVIDAIIAATPYIEKIYEGRCSEIVNVNNYPRLDEIGFNQDDFSKRAPIVCYAGTISDTYGHQIMISSLLGLDVNLLIAGNHKAEKIENIEYLGKLNRTEINSLYKQSIAGLCILPYSKNFINSQPIKMFEYMAAGLPVICSNFEGWSKLMTETNAGICVNWENTKEIQSAVNILNENRKMAQTMGNNGRKAVEEKYSWGKEERKLIELYNKLRTR